MFKVNWQGNPKRDYSSITGGRKGREGRECDLVPKSVTYWLSVTDIGTYKVTMWDECFMQNCEQILNISDLIMYSHFLGHNRYCGDLTRKRNILTRRDSWLWPLLRNRYFPRIRPSKGWQDNEENVWNIIFSVFYITSFIFSTTIFERICLMSVLLGEKNFNLFSDWPWTKPEGRKTLSERGFQTTKKTFVRQSRASPSKTNICP